MTLMQWLGVFLFVGWIFWTVPLVTNYADRGMRLTRVQRVLFWVLLLWHTFVVVCGSFILTIGGG